MNTLDQHCREIERCNQRGGRMLSVVDLLEAGTLSPELAAYLFAAIRGGASFMVGAMPGGAGKTTVMGALLNFVPPEIELRPADSLTGIERTLKSEGEPRCYICHEIGPGDYYAYLWGAALRAYFELPRRGHTLATNLHADTLEQARAQVCEENRVPLEAFRKMHLVLFLRVPGGWSGPREIVQVWESDGAADHQAVYGGGRLNLRASRRVDARQLEQARRCLDRLRASGARTIEEVRAALVSSAI